MVQMAGRVSLMIRIKGMSSDDGMVNYKPHDNELLKKV